ncbi:MAG: alpha/beta fold hydrolase [Alphaproteobacteria bacterium]|nr:MAG: alpha/beta fold hydrolase [Alphaproteobacteria bacterium]
MTDRAADPPRRALLWLAILLTLTACAPRARLVVVPEAGEIGTTHTLFVATTRAREAEAKGIEPFGAVRSETLRRARVAVSVPPAHQLGDITYPGARPDPRTEFVASEIREYDRAAQFRRDLGAALRRLPPARRQAVVFVHGFNTNFAEGVYRFAQLLHDFEIDGVPVHYSWPSLASPLGYQYDRDSTVFSRDGLEETLRDVARAGAPSITIVAHSLGAFLAMETLRQLAIGGDKDTLQRIDGVILLSPDIDVDVFRAQVRRLPRLPQPFVIITSRRDRALKLSALLTGQDQRLGNLRDVWRVADLDVTILDTSEFDDGDALRHFQVASSPVLIQILRSLRRVDNAFAGDVSGRTGLFPGTVLTVQRATAIILAPMGAPTTR